MDMTEEPKRDLKKTAKDIMEVGSDVIGLVANPSVFWLLVLMNASDVGAGFSSYAVKGPPKTQ